MLKAILSIPLPADFLQNILFTALGCVPCLSGDDKTLASAIKEPESFLPRREPGQCLGPVRLVDHNEHNIDHKQRCTHNEASESGVGL
jgi:hypothetical protein